MNDVQAMMKRDPATAARYQPLVVVLAAAVAGIVLDRYTAVPPWVWVALAVTAWSAWLLLWRARREAAASVAILASVAGLAGAWHHARWRLFADDDLGRIAGRDPQPVCLEAITLRLPREIPRGAPSPLAPMASRATWQIDVAAVAIRDGTAWRSCSGRSRFMVDGPPPEVQPGDRLRVFGQLSAPPGPRNPGEFDRAARLRSQRHLSRVQCEAAACISVVADGSPWQPTRWLEQLRVGGSHLLAEHLTARQAPVAAAVLLGEREQIDTELTQAFLETGTIHVLSISGLHVGILAAALLFLLRRLPLARWLALTLMIVATLLYTVLVDAQPPVVRAAMLIVIATAGAFLGRPALGMNALAAAALVVLLLSPADLFRTGVQLSFLCVAGLIAFAPWWMGRSNADTDPLRQLAAETRGPLSRAAHAAGRAAWSLTAAGAVIWVLTLPLVMARFHLFSPVALGLSALVWPPVELAILSGLATLLAGVFCAPLARCCGAVCNFSFATLDALVGGAAKLPGSHFWLPGPDDWWLAGFYGGLAVWAAVPRWRPPPRWCAALLSLWIAVGFSASWATRDRAQLQCTFLSMGHGLSVLVELPDGHTMLYDAGRLGAPEGAAHSIAAVLWSKGITHLDAVVLSHSDTDHYNALPKLLTQFSVGVVYVSPVMFENDKPAITYLRAAIERAGVPIRAVRAGDRLAAGPDCRIEVLHPPRNGILGSDNANSVVLTVEQGDRRVLLPGDLERPGLNDLLAELPQHCDILLVPHHGSRASNPQGLAEWATPGWVVISGSNRWDTEPIADAYRVAGAEVLHTDRCGALSLRLGPQGVSVSRYLAPD